MKSIKTTIKKGTSWKLNLPSYYLNDSYIHDSLYGILIKNHIINKFIENVNFRFLCPSIREDYTEMNILHNRLNNQLNKKLK